MGLVTGVLLSIVMACALVAANRFPLLEHVAMLRNALSYAAFALAMIVPVALFPRLPSRLFASAMIGWIIFVLAYSIACMYFVNLSNSLGKTPFHLLILGALFYGVISAGLWVSGMLFSAMRYPIAPGRRRPRHAVHHR
jgi:MFS family permease